MRTTRTAIATLSLVALLITAFGASTALAGGRPFSTTLTGSAEIGGGDLDGSGTAALTLNPGLGQVCYDYSVSGVAPLTAAHIHVGAAGTNGPVVIPLPPTSGTGGSDCVTADRQLIIAIIRNPAGYYVNVHNADFPGGALRGQLSR